MPSLTFVKILPILIFINACAQVEESNLKKHIEVLASDEYKGRGTGAEGGKKAASYIEKQFKLIGLLPKGETNSFTQSFTFKSGIHNTGKEGITSNVIGFIDNGAATTVIIGAHYDHLGMGNEGSSLDANPANKIHNGADDNASGTAGVIELARYFQSNKLRESTNFLFICFSGEELGLLGSKYFTEHPTIDLSKINYMINMDMVGRLDPITHGLVVSGSGTSAVWEPLLQKLSNDKVNIKTDSSGMGPSDHSSFYLKKIPALHFFTGSHSDYHKPSDDYDKINYNGEKEVLNVIINLVEQLNGQPKLTFLATKNKSMEAARSFKVTLGIMPSYSSKEEGLEVDGVSDGKPAQKAGIQAGDVIVQLGELPIKDINEYMEALGKFEKGQTISVKVKRGKEIILKNLTF